MEDMVKRKGGGNKLVLRRRMPLRSRGVAVWRRLVIVAFGTMVVARAEKRGRGKSKSSPEFS